MEKRKRQRSDKSRADTITTIWQNLIVILMVCIPLCLTTRSVALPIAAIFGATFVTVYLWSSRGKSDPEETSENEALRTKIKELEERLANVEVINRFEDRLAEKRLRREMDETRSMAPRDEERG